MKPQKCMKTIWSRDLSSFVVITTRKLPFMKPLLYRTAKCTLGEVNYHNFMVADQELKVLVI